MINKLLILFLISYSYASQAKLLDRIYAEVGDNVITKQEVDRIKSNIPARRMIAPLIYQKGAYSDKEIVDILVQNKLIAAKLTEIGIDISDSMVEERVKGIEKAQGVNRSFLVNFLRSKNLSYDEYFSLIKQMMQLTYFNSRIIAPLVSINNEEVKTAAKKRKSKIKRGMIYSVINYAFPASVLNQYSDAQVKNILLQYQTDPATLPSAFAGMQANQIELKSRTLSKEIYKIISQTKSNSFSKPKVLNGNTIVFFVKSKRGDVVNAPQVNNDQVKQEIIAKKSTEAIKRWVDAEKLNKHIKTLI